MKLYYALMTGLVACSFAIADSTTTTMTTTTSTEKAAPAKAKKAMAAMQIKGTIVSVDAIANTIIVTPMGKKKVDDTLATTDKTVVMPKGKTVADLKADDKVTVSYKTEDGKMVATQIKLWVGKAPKKMAAPAAPAAAPAGSN